MKIQILGHRLSGKTQLAKYLSKKLSIKYLDTNQYLKLELEKRYQKYSEDIQVYDSYVVDGWTVQWMQSGFYNVDYIFILMLNYNEVIERLNNLELRQENLFEVGAIKRKEYNQKDFDDIRDMKKYKAIEKELQLIINITKANVILLNGEHSLKQNYFKVIDALKIEKGRKK